MSEWVNEQRGAAQATTTDSDGPVKDGAVAVAITVDIGDRLSLVFDGDGCEVMPGADAWGVVRLSHAEFDKLMSLPICAIRSALRTDHADQIASSWPADIRRTVALQHVEGVGGQLRALSGEELARQRELSRTIAGEMRQARAAQLDRIEDRITRSPTIAVAADEEPAR